MPKFRIVSLLPSATEIVAALGLLDSLVGCSHECDYPEQVKTLPICTAANLDSNASSSEIHFRVSELLRQSLSIYRLDLAQIEQLQPTHIITQAQCDVCAVTLTDVEAAVRDSLPSQPVLISLQPNTLSDVWQDLERTAQVFGVDSQPVITELQQRIAKCESQTLSQTESQSQIQNQTRPRVACIEWTDPLMAAGNWVPELVHLAGGNNLFGRLGQHSPWLDWAELLAADPEVMVFMPCGFNLRQTRQAVAEIATKPEWQNLQAVQADRVYVTDGNQYFNRPGPRLVDSVEILAEILHPQVCHFGHEGTGWQPY
jgi:iron complex transport system substrate-binding protein